MTLQQLRYVCEIVDRGFSVSRAAAALHTSQPSMSRQVQALEKELGVPIFTRSKRRLLGLSAPGAQICEAARQALRITDRLRHVGKEFFTRDSGALVVVTSHTHARYVLPKVIQSFTLRYPKVRLTLRQGNPMQVAEWVSAGEADLSICSRPNEDVPGVVLLPCYDQHKIVLVPRGHALLRKKPLSIEALAMYPLITYDTDFQTHSQVTRAFQASGLQPNVILSATDVDVMKAYVKCSLGIAIVAALAYEPKADVDLRPIDARHLFESNKIYVGIQKHALMRDYACDFIRLFAPALTREKIMAAVA